MRGEFKRRGGEEEESLKRRKAENENKGKERSERLIGWRADCSVLL